MAYAAGGLVVVEPAESLDLFEDVERGEIFEQLAREVGVDLRVEGVTRDPLEIREQVGDRDVVGDFGHGSAPVLFGGLPDVLGVDGFLAGGGGEGEGEVGEDIDASHDARGGGVEGLDGLEGEDGSVCSGDPEAVLEVGFGVVSVEPSQVVAHGDALGEGFEVGEP